MSDSRYINCLFIQTILRLQFLVCDKGNVFFKKNWPSPAYFLFFRLFNQTLQFYTTNKCEKCQSSIQCWDSNPQHLEHESPPITTRPGLQPNVRNFIIVNTGSDLIYLILIITTKPESSCVDGDEQQFWSK